MFYITFSWASDTFTYLPYYKSKLGSLCYFIVELIFINNENVTATWNLYVYNKNM
jgi:hypothetical protein